MYLRRKGLLLSKMPSSDCQQGYTEFTFVSVLLSAAAACCLKACKPGRAVLVPESSCTTVGTWSHQPHAASAAGTRGQGPSVATGGTDATAASGRATRVAAAKQVRLGVQHDTVHCPQAFMLESINDSHGMHC